MYLKYLEDNINGVFNNDMEEYMKYVKLYYTENARCPEDLKTVLDKEETKKQIKNLFFSEKCTRLC